MLSKSKIFTFHCRSKTPVFLKLFTQMPTLNIVELKRSFRKSIECLRSYRILAGTVYRLKVGNFKCCPCGKFSPCHCKSNIPPQLKLSIQMRTLNIVELKQSFRKSVEYLSRYGIFPGTLYRLKVGKFKCSRCAKFSPCHFKVKYCAPEPFHPNSHPQHRRAEAKFSKIGWIPLEI